VCVRGVCAGCMLGVCVACACSVRGVCAVFVCVVLRSKRGLLDTRITFPFTVLNTLSWTMQNHTPHVDFLCLSQILDGVI
jgi:hypothetical protein